MVARIFTFLIGVVLLPVCYAVSLAAYDLILRITPDSIDGFPPSVCALAGGYFLWILLYFTMPMPVRTYVLAHELTHALWGTMMGARVFKMRISRDSGSVTLSKTNFLITLAPYFFPLYTVIVITVYYVLSVFYDVSEYQLVWLGLVGFTWGFHFTFTISTLMQHQSDIKEYGSLFSYTLIYLFNILGICIWILVISGITVEQTANIAVQRFAETANMLWNAGVRVSEEIVKLRQ